MFVVKMRIRVTIQHVNMRLSSGTIIYIIFNMVTSEMNIHDYYRLQVGNFNLIRRYTIYTGERASSNNLRNMSQIESGQKAGK